MNCKENRKSSHSFKLPPMTEMLNYESVPHYNKQWRPFTIKYGPRNASKSCKINNIVNHLCIKENKEIKFRRPVSTCHMLRGCNSIRYSTMHRTLHDKENNQLSINKSIESTHNKLSHLENVVNVMIKQSTQRNVDSYMIK